MHSHVEKSWGEMTDIGTIEKRTVYRIPEGEGFHSPYVGSEPWSEGTVTVDGDMMPVEQQAIPWCTTHDISKDIPNPNPAADRPGDCFLAEYREGECVISTWGPDHKWWVDV